MLAKRFVHTGFMVSDTRLCYKDKTREAGSTAGRKHTGLCGAMLGVAPQKKHARRCQ